MSSFDFPFRFASPKAPDDVRIIYMDEASHAKLGQSFNSWHRSLHAQLLKELTARGAKAVVFDVLFDSPWPKLAGTNLFSFDDQLKQALESNRELHVERVKPEQVDSQFAKAIRAASNVVLAVKLDFDDPHVPRMIFPIDEIGESIHSGVTEMPRDPGVVPAIRQQYYDPSYPTYTNLAWTVAEMLGLAPPDRTQTRYLNYYGPRDTIEHISYHRVLESNAVSPDFFAGKVVFVGMGRLTTTRGKSTDDFATPYTRWSGETTQGVEIQATAYLNLVHGHWLTELSPAMEFFLFIGIGLLCGYGFLLVRPWTAAGLAVFGLLAIGSGALLLVWKYRIWFPWLIPGAVQIPCGLVWTLLWNTKSLYREKEILEKRLATAQSSHPPAPSDLAPQAVPASSMEVTQIAPGPVSRQTDKAPRIPDHELLRQVGKGAYGEVWLARDAIGTFHAVKIIYRKTFSSDGPFEREFKGIQKFTPISLSHPGFVHVLHVGRNPLGGYFYYIMEAGDDEVSGQQINAPSYSPKNLANEIDKRGKLPLPECLQLSLHLSAALDYLHCQQLIHRDIKPSNIIFVKGVPKIADIGLVTDIAEVGRGVTYLGTEGYIPPEGPGTPAADVYSLGKVIYEVGIGRPLSEYSEWAAGVNERPESRELLHLKEIIRKACADDVRLRYKSMAEMRADLLALQSQTETESAR